MLWLVLAVEGFPRSQKFMLGDHDQLSRRKTVFALQYVMFLPILSVVFLKGMRKAHAAAKNTAR